MRPVLPDDMRMRALFDREHDAMLQLAVLLVSSREAAEDIVQDAFAAVDDRWDSIDNHGAYLRTTVVNGCRMLLRRRATAAAARPTPPTELTSESAEHLVELLLALEQLEETQRVAVVLRYLNDLPFRDVAAAMQCPSSTARSHVRRGLASLRDLLKEENE